MKSTIRTIASSLLIYALLVLTACDTSQVQQFKNYWIGGVKAVDAFSAAIQNNANVSASLKAKAKLLVTKLDPTKPLVKSLTVFPPVNREELADLLKEVIPVLQDIAGDSSIGTAISIAASAAIAFFQIESDMLDQTGPPPGASGAPSNPSARLPELKSKLDDLKAAVKALK